MSNCSTHQEQRIWRILARLTPLGRRACADAAARLLVLAKLRGAVPVVMQELKAMAIQVNIKDHPFLMDIFAQELAKGEAKALPRLIERRHGPVSEAVAQRVRAASVDDLDRWLDALIDAPSLDASSLDAILSASRH